jgi:hypothetical protein
MACFPFCFSYLREPSFLLVGQKKQKQRKGRPYANRSAGIGVSYAACYLEYSDYGPLVFSGDGGSLQKRWLNMDSAFYIEPAHHLASSHQKLTDGNKIDVTRWLCIFTE